MRLHLLLLVSMLGACQAATSTPPPVEQVAPPPRVHPAQQSPPRSPSVNDRLAPTRKLIEQGAMIARQREDSKR